MRGQPGEAGLHALEIAEHRVAENLFAAAGLAARLRPRLGPGRAKLTSSCGLGTGSGRISIWSKREKIAEFAPIPSASDRIATSAMNGDLNRVRKARRRLGITDVWTRIRGSGLGIRKISYDMVKTYGLTHVAVAVRDLDRTEAFYSGILGAKIVYRDAGFLQMQTPGSRDVLVFEKDAKKAGKAGGVLHFGFRLMKDMGGAVIMAGDDRARDLRSSARRSAGRHDHSTTGGSTESMSERQAQGGRRSSIRRRPHTTSSMRDDDNRQNAGDRIADRQRRLDCEARPVGADGLRPDRRALLESVLHAQPEDARRDDLRRL